MLTFLVILWIPVPPLGRPDNLAVNILRLDNSSNLANFLPRYLSSDPPTRTLKCPSSSLYHPTWPLLPRRVVALNQGFRICDNSLCMVLLGRPFIMVLCHLLTWP